MIEAIKGIFDKSSPLFMINIAFFVITIIALGYPTNQSCIYGEQMRQFEIVLAITTGAAILFKTIVLEIITKLCSSNISAIHILIIVVHLIADLALYVWSLNLYLSIQKYPICFENEPHLFLIQVYAALYTLINVALLIIIVSLKLQSKIMTVLNREGVKNDDSF